MQTKAAFLSLLIGSLAIATLCFGERRSDQMLGGPVQGPNSTSEEASDGMWTHEGKSLKILGLCNITASEVACWDVKGNDAKDLAERVKAGLLSGSNYGNEPSFKFGMKNRFVILDGQVNQLPVQFSSAADPTGNIQTFGFNGPTSSISCARIVAEKTAKTFDLKARVSGLPGPKPVRVPFTVGGKADYDGRVITIGGWKRGGELNRGFYPYGNDQNNTKKPSAWSVFLGIDSREGKNPYGNYLIATIQDKEGKPISYVDAKGKPITDLEYIKAAEPNRNGFYNPGIAETGKASPSTFQMAPNGPNAPSAFTYVTNVDPQYIGSIEVATQRSVEVFFRGLPLDPITP